VEESTEAMAVVVAAVVPDQDKDPIKDAEATDGAEEDPYRLDVQEVPVDVARRLARVDRNADVDNIVPTVVPMITMDPHANFIKHIAADVMVVIHVLLVHVLKPTNWMQWLRQGAHAEERTLKPYVEARRSRVIPPTETNYISLILNRMMKKKSTAMSASQTTVKDMKFMW
jgi:hypothetical protein